MKIYFVEDDEILCGAIARYFEKKKCTVTFATSYEQAEIDLKGKNISGFDVLLMDLKIESTQSNPRPKQGVDFLEELSDRNEKLPRTVIYSGFLDEEIKEWCRYLGAEWVFGKGAYEPNELYNLIKAKNKEQPRFCTKTLSKIVRKREESLKNHALMLKQKPFAVSRFAEPLFIVARRWNSWYPCIFNVPGGAYAIVCPPADCSAEMPSIVIDPGFRFMNIFNDLGINIQNVNSCVVSHNHPDHMGGIFEYLAARATYGKVTGLFFSPAMNGMLNCFAGPLANVHELNNNDIPLLPEYKAGGNKYEILCKSFNTAHEEIGPRRDSKGLIITVRKESGGDSFSPKIVILGDTEYARDRQMVKKFCTNGVKLTVLHIGSAQLKETVGKHLYLQGTLDILTEMENELFDTDYQGKMTVLISEWGLEHATQKQLERVFDSHLPGFNNVSPIEEMMRIIKGLNFRKLIVIPADIGLTFGMISGNIYLDDQIFKSAEITFEAGNEGLEYFAGENK